MERQKKGAAEKLRQLLSSDFDGSVEINIRYESCSSNTDTSLLIVNR